MKSRFLIIIGVVLLIAITSTLILNYYIDEEIKSQMFSDEQIDRIYKRCDYQKRMDDRNWIGLDGNKITDHQPLYIWNNSTHRIDNNICEWQTIEKYESDASLRDALARCWTGNSEFLDDDFVLWNNETHYIDYNTCEWKLLENYPDSDILCIPGQHVENNEHRIRNGTHIYNNEACMWEELEICTGYCGELENEK